MTYEQYLEELKALRTKREMEPCEVSMEDLEKTIEAARYTASAMNAQRIRAVLVNDKDISKKMFDGCNLPTKHQIPDHQACSAFIVLGQEEDKEADFVLGLDVGIWIQAIREALHTLGYVSVDLHTFNRNIYKELINLDNFYALNVIGIGKSNQEVRVVDASEGGTFKDENKIHHVRKLTTDQLIVKKI